MEQRCRRVVSGWMSWGFLVAALVAGGVLAAAGPRAAPTSPGELVRVPGGTFRMGDLFGDGEDNERPVHTVTLRSFLISPTEVTVGQSRQFVAATSHRTSAEHPENADGFEKTMARVSARGAGADGLRLRYRLLQEVDASAAWDSDGSLPPNALGLHEMSGNDWEWVSDHHATYSRNNSGFRVARSDGRGER
jgi:formylglycine-generating enzyme required for sulfatase activity